MGEVGILNVGAGDTKLVFDNSNPTETAKSAQIVQDMIRRGYVLLIEIGRDDKGPMYRRAHDFDPETCEYIIAGTITEQDQKHDEPKNKAVSAVPPRRRKGKEETRIPASKTSAVAVARTAGG